MPLPHRQSTAAPDDTWRHPAAPARLKSADVLEFGRMGKKPKSLVDSYYELYRGHTLLLSLVGRHKFVDRDYDSLMLDVADLVQERINILLVSSTQLAEMANSLVERFGAEINEVLLVNQQGGVRDSLGRLIPLLTLNSIRRILAGEHPSFKRITADLRSQLEQVAALLPSVEKVTLISPTGLKSEITQWRGSGTMCIDATQLTLAPLREEEYPIFRRVHESFVAENKFRVRSERELEEVARCHQILKAKNSPLAGYSLLEHEPPWLEFCVWWAQYRGDGFGARVLDAARQQAQERGRRIFALSTEQDAIENLERHCFQNLGRISQLDRSGRTDLPEAVRHYDTNVRDPELLVQLP